MLCYRPPDFDRSDFNALLEETLFKVSMEFDQLVLLGDFNLPDIDWHHPESAICSSDSDFINIVFSYALTQKNDIPSNVHMHVLDLIFSNGDDLVKNVFKVDCCFSTDHAVLSFDMCLRISRNSVFNREMYNYKRGNFDLLYTMLNNSLLLDVLTDACDIDTMWNSWYEGLFNAVDQCIPKISIKCFRDPPWFDGEMRHVTNKKRTAWKRAKRSNTPAAWVKFRSLRNQTCSLARFKQKSFINSLALDCKKNPKRFWSFFKSKTKNHSLPDEISNGNVSCTDPQGKAFMFNSYFISLFTPNDDTYAPASPPSVVPVIPDPVFTSDEIDVILVHLDVNSACGPSGISPVILKQCHRLLSPSLAVIFNVSIQTSKIPSQWKKANVTPVFKKGDKHTVSNYRPISLLCCVSKVMERCVFNHVYPFVENRLHPLQHGFIKGRSCATQLLKVYHQIGSVLDKGGQVDIIFLDFSKAFDCISHSLLLHKLQAMFGFDGRLLTWVKNYLSDRYQRVVIENSSSDWLPVHSGVPQGSILGPLLFLLFINDLPTVATNCFTALFADDSKCFKEISSENDCLLLQADIDNMYRWSESWQMKFNPSKCKVLSVTRRFNPVVFDYRISGSSLEHVGVFKDLGVVIDKTLSFSSHINELVMKCNKVCGFIKRSVGFNAPVEVKVQLFKSLCLPLLDYCSPVWSPQCKTYIKKIESVQRSMSKFILPNSTLLPYTQRLTDLKLLPLTFKREINDLLLLYKILNGLLNVDFSSEISFNNVSSRRCNGIVLKLSLVRTETFMASYFNRVVHLWNSLPFNVKNASSFTVFKNNLVLFYVGKLPSFNVDDSCSWISTCRCYGFYHS